MALLQKNDLQLKASYGSSPPCTQVSSLLNIESGKPVELTFENQFANARVGANNDSES